MSTESKDQSKRVAQIAILQLVVAQHALAIETQRLLLNNMEAKQVNRLAELRMQKLFLVNAERARLRSEAAGSTRASRVPADAPSAGPQGASPV